MSQFINIQSEVFPWHLHPAQLFALALEHGLSADQLLSAAGLDQQAIQRGDLMISWQQYSGMAQLVERHCPPHWGILLGQRLTLASHGILSLAVMNCSDWDQVLDLLVKFKNLVTALFYVEKRETAEHIILLLRPEFSRDPLTSKYIECFFLAIYQGIFTLASFRHKLTESDNDFCIYLQHQRPEYAELAADAFHQNIQYGHWCYALKVNKQYLQTPINNSGFTSSNPVTTNNMVTILQSQMQQMPVLTGELHALHKLFENQIFNLDACAHQLHTSSTTLKRRLKLAGSTFNQELKDYRLQEAHFLLQYSELSQEDISLQLGFQDMGSFRRFFKMAAGVTPTDFRGTSQKTFQHEV